MFFSVVIAISLIFLLDTGSLVEWVAAHRETKIDEVLVASVILLLGVTVFSTRRWLGLSKRLIQYEASRRPEDLLDAGQLKNGHRRGGIALFAGLTVAVAFVFLFDTGKLAQWIAEHKETKIDETIVATVIFLIGVSCFSIRRQRELSDLLIEYEQLHRRTGELDR